MTDHGQLIEFLGTVKRGARHCREMRCPKCGVDAPHEFTCLQPANPRKWLVKCRNCKPAYIERRERDAKEARDTQGEIWADGGGEWEVGEVAPLRGLQAGNEVDL